MCQIGDKVAQTRWPFIEGTVREIACKIPEYEQQLPQPIYARVVDNNGMSYWAGVSELMIVSKRRY
jgi:hypothetical protein